MRHSTGSAKRRHPVWRFIGRSLAVLGILLVAVAVLFAGSLALICKGPSVKARDLFVTSLHQHDTLGFLPGLFLSDGEIAAILSANRLLPTEAITDTETDLSAVVDNNTDPIRKLTLKGSNYTRTLLIVKDPSRIELACVSSFGADRAGASLETFAEQTQAVAAIGSGTGSVPVGYVIQNGNLIYGEKSVAASLVGFDGENRLIVGSMTAEKAIACGIRNAVCSPVYPLIVNGTAAEIAGLGDGIRPRAVIGQRANGAVLLMVMDGITATDPGVMLEDCIAELLKAGAINAALLDSSDSAALLYQNTLQNNAPDAQDRCVPAAFVVL